MDGGRDEDPLLAALREVLREHGWAGTTMERIARAAGVSRVTLHRQGVSKHALLQALVEQATERYRAALWPALVADGPAADRLEQALGALCSSAEEELEVLLALRSQADAVFHEEGDEALTRTVFTEPLERILRDGAADGTLGAGDPAETATVLFNLVGWTYVHLRTGHRWAPARAAAATVGIALRGVAGPRGSGPTTGRMKA